MVNLWTNLDRYLESFDSVHGEELEHIFKEFYWHLYKLTGFVADLRPFPKLILTLFRNSFLVGTFVWHIILFLFTIPLILEESHMMIRNMHFLLFITFSLTLFFWFTYQRKRILNTHRLIAEGFPLYGTEGEIITARLVQNFRKTYIVSLSILPFAICSSALFMFFASAVDEATGSPPRVDPENGIDIYLPVKLWYPWDTKKWHYLQFAHELLLAAYVGIIISTSDLLFVNITYTLCLHLELLLVSLGNLEKRAYKEFKELYPDQRPIKKYSDPKFLNCYESCLKKNVLHHQFINRLFNVCEPLARIPIFFAFVMEAIVLGMSGLDLVTGGERIGDMILNILLCLAELSNMAILCWYGQRIINLSEKVHDAMYNTKWYLCNRQVTSVLKLVQCRSRKPMVIMGGIWPCDLASFQAVMNSAYSYFNLLVAFREK